MEWYSHLGPNTDKIHHAQEIKRAGRTMNLRCIAHFGFDTDSGLTHLARRIFMLSFGTQCDSRINWGTPDYSSEFINDALYEEMNDIPSERALPTLQGRGLNRTWSSYKAGRALVSRLALNASTARRHSSAERPNMDLNYQVQASYDAGSYEQSKPENDVAQCVMPSHRLRLHERGKR
jgi:hypothetical protein